MPGSLVELQKTIVALKEQDIESDSLYCFQSGEIHIESNEEIKWTLDGEYGGSGRILTVINHKTAVSYAKGEKNFLT